MPRSRKTRPLVRRWLSRPPDIRYIRMLGAMGDKDIHPWYHLSILEAPNFIAAIDKTSRPSFDKIRMLFSALNSHLKKGGTDRFLVRGERGRGWFPHSSYAKLVSKLLEEPAKWHADPVEFVRMCVETPFDKGSKAQEFPHGYIRDKLSRSLGDYMLFYTTDFTEECINLASRLGVGTAEKPLRVLDVGAGRGFFLYELMSSCKKKGIHIEPIGVVYETWPGMVKGVSFVKATGENLPLRGETIHLAVTTETLQYVPDKLRFINEMHRVLVKGGIMFVYMPDPANTYDEKGHDIFLECWYMRGFEFEKHLDRLDSKGIIKFKKRVTPNVRNPCTSYRIEKIANCDLGFPRLKESHPEEPGEEQTGVVWYSYY